MASSMDRAHGQTAGGREGGDGLGVDRKYFLKGFGVFL